MPDYTDLYKLRISETPYTAERIIDEVLQSSPECQLPTDVPLTLDLPPLTVELPPLECKFDNLVPIIPLPDFCHPHVVGTITATSCNTSLITATSTVSVTQINDCDFQLGGSIEICPGIGLEITCIDPLTFSGSITPTGGGLSGSISLENDGSCGAILTGTITSDAKCSEGVVALGTITPTGAGLTGSIAITDDPLDCTVTLSGSLALDVACIDPVTGGGEVNFTINPPLSGSGTIYLTDNSPCGVTVNGIVDISLTKADMLSTLGASFQPLDVCISGVTTTIYVLTQI